MEKFSENDVSRSLAFATMLICAIAFYLFSLVNPMQNWDMLGYAASVATLGDYDPVAVHENVYAQFKAYASTAQFYELSASTEYRRVMYQDADAFIQQVPFYKIRILFVLMVLALTKAGMNIFDAMHFLSAGFGSASLLVIYFGFRRYVHSIFWIAVPLFYYHFSHDLLVTQAGGVDSFAFFWVALMSVAFVRYSRWLLPLMAVSVLVRTDLILYIALLFGLVWLADRSKWLQIGLWGLLTLVFYVAVNKWAANYGWQTVFYFVFVSDMSATHPDVYSKIGFTFDQYLYHLTHPTWVSKWLWVAMASACVAGVLFWRHSSVKAAAGSEMLSSYQRLVVIGLVCAVYTVLHYLLFPVVFMRFFFGQWLLMLIALFASLSCIFQSKQALNALSATNRVRFSD